MKMVFSDEETSDIIRAHVTEKWGIPDSKVAGIGWETWQDNKGKWRLRFTIDVMTDRGGPYREPGRADDPVK